MFKRKNGNKTFTDINTHTTTTPTRFAESLYMVCIPLN